MFFVVNTTFVSFLSAIVFNSMRSQDVLLGSDVVIHSRIDVLFGSEVRLSEYRKEIHSL